MRIAIQGEEGSYHHIAAESYFGSDNELECCETFAAVFDALQSGAADSGIVGAENSIAGTVHPVYDLLLKHDFFVAGEVYEQIHHNLITLPGADLKAIARVYSHPMALPQCSDFFDEFLPQAERIEYSDTAASVAHIKQLGDNSNAAVASSMAARLHDLPIAHTNIENFSNNVTRFLILSRNHKPADAADKTSFVLETPHEPGALWHALGILAAAQINLTKLESRPIPKQPWRYQFLIDVESAGKSLHDTVHKLEERGCNVRILGEYVAGRKTTS